MIGKAETNLVKTMLTSFLDGHKDCRTSFLMASEEVDVECRAAIILGAVFAKIDDLTIMAALSADSELILDIIQMSLFSMGAREGEYATAWDRFQEGKKKWTTLHRYGEGEARSILFNEDAIIEKAFFIKSFIISTLEKEDLISSSQMGETKNKRRL